MRHTHGASRRVCHVSETLLGHESVSSHARSPHILDNWICKLSL
jgi:hypothetical protein